MAWMGQKAWLWLAHALVSWRPSGRPHRPLSGWCQSLDLVGRPCKDTLSTSMQDSAWWLLCSRQKDMLQCWHRPYASADSMRLLHTVALHPHGASNGSGSMTPFMRGDGFFCTCLATRPSSYSFVLHPRLWPREWNLHMLCSQFLQTMSFGKQLHASEGPVVVEAGSGKNLRHSRSVGEEHAWV